MHPSMLNFCALLLWASAASAQEPPNIVFFYTDDQSYDSVGCYGNPDVKTPNMDLLGAQGIIFTRHYNTTAICMASRANVMTGLYEYRNGTNFSHGPLATNLWEKSYPVLLREAGYRTGFGGKFGFAVVDDPREGGSESRYENLPVDDFDFWVGGTGQTEYETTKNKYLAKYAEEFPHSSRAYGAAGRDFIRESVAAEKPFCLTLFFKAPHRPTTPDPYFDDIYADTTFRKLPNYGREAGEHLAPQHKLGRQYPRFVSWGYDTDARYQAAMRTYHQQIYGVDYAMGMVLEALEEQGVADNTVVIFSSDNGFFNGSHGLGSKVLPYEEGARVPFIIYDPRQPEAQRGRRAECVTGNIDIATTIMDLAGVAPSPDLDGVSLVPILTGAASSARDSLTLIQAWGTRGTLCMGVVTDRHKFVYWPYAEGDMNPTEELFDLGRDAYEMKNVLDDPEYARVLDDMRTRYDGEVSRWKEMAVPYNHYEPFGTLYDRDIAWEDKRGIIPRQFGNVAGD